MVIHGIKTKGVQRYLKMEKMVSLIILMLLLKKTKEDYVGVDLLG